MSKKTQVVQITESELSQVKDNTLNASQLNFLMSKTPQQYIKSRKGKGGQTWTYVSGYYMKKVLNFMFGWDWDFIIEKEMVEIEAGQVIVRGRLVCRTGGKEIIKTQYGRADIKFLRSSQKPVDLGNDCKAAATDSLKKCAAELGIAMDVYSPGDFNEKNVTRDGGQDLDLDLIETAIKAMNDKASIEAFFSQVFTDGVASDAALAIFENRINELSVKKS